VPVAPDPEGDGREQLLDLLLFSGRPDHFLPLRCPLPPQVVVIGFLRPGEFPLDRNLDAEFFRVREMASAGGHLAEE
jgi:hypothetical protein